MSVIDILSDCPSKRWLEMHLDHQDKEFCLIWPLRLASNGYGQIGEDNHIPHRLMCEHRHGTPPSDQHQAAHSCGRGHDGCVNPWHLNWRTPAENQCERYFHSGLAQRTKLTRAQVDEILDVKGKEIARWTAKRFGVSEANIRQIQSGKTWNTDSPKSRPLTITEVQMIRNTPGKQKSARKVADELGVLPSVIYRVRARETYLWVPEPQEQGK